jgi:2,4-dienoyl-CoA reductase-like NADH-dependent reductase (Old Yellow Enzyme family)
MHLLRRIERYLRETDTPAARFGREAVRDPRFVFDLRLGREPRRQTEQRVRAFLDARQPEGLGR